MQAYLKERRQALVLVLLECLHESLWFGQRNRLDFLKKQDHTSTQLHDRQIDAVHFISIKTQELMYKISEQRYNHTEAL
jgi:hypothetical protein